MTDEIEYKETIEQTIPKNAEEYFFYDLKETYREEFGWIIKDIITKEIDNKSIQISLTIEKHKMETTSKIR